MVLFPRTIRPFGVRLPSRNLTTRISSRSIVSNNSFFRVSEEVQDALHSNKPVVALETTIYTHGFPYPDNVALASHLESIVRTNGGVPATIGILDGIARVGLSAEELIQLTSSAGSANTLKLSRRDLSFVCGSRLAGKSYHGGTTIAGTMILAHMAGIKVFGTGGLGGVHRGGEMSMDVSADLTELGRTAVAVVSSGCKSFLDIGRTLEYLETEGVGVATFADGRVGGVDFPGFWSRDSGVKSPGVVGDERHAAGIIYAQHALQISSGLLFANPCPAEAAIPKEEMDVIIEKAILEADRAGISGKDNTPFILAKVKELSGGKSIPANRALIESNVRRATIVARELAVLEAQQMEAEGGPSSYYTPPSTPLPQLAPDVATSPAAETTTIKTPSPQPDLVAAGALAVDFSCDYTPLPGTPTTNTIDPISHTSNPAEITQSLGGVAHNIAKAAHYMGASVHLFSAIGQDFSGRAALQQLESENMATSGITVFPSPHRTAQYVAINNAHKDLAIAMADMSILETETASRLPEKWLESARTNPPKCFIADANWSSETLNAWFRAAKSVGAITAFEPVSTAKAIRIFNSNTPLPVYPNHIIDIATPNAMELNALYTTASNLDLFSSEKWFAVIDALGIPDSGLRVPLAYATSSELVNQGIPQRSIQLLPFVGTVVTKLGAKGVLVTQLLPAGHAYLSSAEHSKYVVSRNKSDGGGIGVGGLYVRLFEPGRVLSGEEVVSVNGAGDTFLGVLGAGVVRGAEVVEVIRLGMRGSECTLGSVESVSGEVRGLRGELDGLVAGEGVK